MDFWSGNCRQTLVNAGWRCVEYDGRTDDIPFGAVILWEQDRHAVICSAAGSLCIEASDDYDGVQGDSSGNEIRERAIYGEWTGASGAVHRADYVLIPPYSQAQIGAGITYGRAIVNDDRWGYSMERRWQDFYRDCTSLCADIIQHMIDFDSEYSYPTETQAQTGLESLTDVANRVILGEYGNMPERKERLEADGWNYDEVRAEVNRLLGCETEEPAPSAVDDDTITAVALQVIHGDWGNMPERKDNLEAAGWNYEQIQARVNELC